MPIYSNKDLDIIKEYRLKNKYLFSNKRGVTDKLTTIDILNTLKRSAFKCFYCKQKLNKKTRHLDHFFPLYLGGKNTPENIVPACKWCNTMKNALDGHSFLIRCKIIYMANLETEIPSPSKKNETIKLLNK